jgi:hypothetical protein
MYTAEYLETCEFGVFWVIPTDEDFFGVWVVLGDNIGDGGAKAMVLHYKLPISM